MEDLNKLFHGAICSLETESSRLMTDSIISDDINLRIKILALEFTIIWLKNSLLCCDTYDKLGKRLNNFKKIINDSRLQMAANSSDIAYGCSMLEKETNIDQREFAKLVLLDKNYLYFQKEDIRRNKDLKKKCSVVKLQAAKDSARIVTDLLNDEELNTVIANSGYKIDDKFKIYSTHFKESLADQFRIAILVLDRLNRVFKSVNKARKL